MLTRAQFVRRGLGVAAAAFLHPRALVELLEPGAEVEAAIEPVLSIADTWSRMLRELYAPAVTAQLNRTTLLLAGGPVRSGETVRIPLVLSHR